MENAAEIIGNSVASAKTDMLEGIASAKADIANVQKIADFLTEGLSAVAKITKSSVSSYQGKDIDGPYAHINIGNPLSLVASVRTQGIDLYDHRGSLSGDGYFTGDIEGAEKALRKAVKLAVILNKLPADYQPTLDTSSLTKPEAIIQEAIAEVRRKEAQAIERDKTRDFEKEIDPLLANGLKRLRDMRGSTFEFNIAAVSPGSKKLKVTTNVPGREEEPGDMTEIRTDPKYVSIQHGSQGYSNSNTRATNKTVLKRLTERAALYNRIPL